MKSLTHSGVMVTAYEPKGYSVKHAGRVIKLAPEQEEMAVAWVRKLGTDYAKDPVFEANFFEDFSNALGVGKASAKDFDFSEIEAAVNKERAAKEAMPKEQKKKQAADRKVVREANKSKYGQAVVDGEAVDLSNYVVEPSSIFMGRGQHPLRGRWKRGATYSDITLNLSPDAKRPPGKWKEVVWNPEFLWIARWDDSLRGKEKYVWLAETSPLRQKKEQAKFDKAVELAKKYDAIMKHIVGSLSDEDEKRRKVATVCYLIDALNIRVGDEKGEDEADTVGATTLTNKNVIVKGGNTVEFDFLGKDSVRMQRELELPSEVVRNLKEFVADAEKRAGREGKAMLFDGVRSEGVRAFLDEVAPDVTAKVFRTFHSTQAVEEYLAKNPVKPDDDEDYKRYVAAMANLQAAIVCNHKRKLPKNWEESLRKKEDALLRLEQRLEEARKKAKEKAAADMAKAKKELIASVKSGKDAKARKPAARRDPAAKAKEALERARLRLKALQATKDYNLNTSLKNYIDPRVYKRWADKVCFDWTKYYPKTMQKKFSWVEKCNP